MIQIAFEVQKPANTAVGKKKKQESYNIAQKLPLWLQKCKHLNRMAEQDKVKD